MGMFGPLAMDVYLAALPQLASDLHASSSEAQATLSACLFGLAAGQIIAGPISDRFGRRPIMIVGVSTFMAASLLCALAPNIWLLVVFRLVQGLAGATGIVVSRAAVRDYFQGSDVAKVLSRLTVITGIAPIAAPLIGGGLVQIMDWRGVFVVLGGIGALLLIALLIWVPESLAPENRFRNGFRDVLTQMGILFRDPVFVRYTLVGAAAGTAFFGYISMIALVLQGEYHIDPLTFSILFGVNATGLILGAQLNSWLVTRFSLRRILFACLIAALIGSGLIVLTSALGLSLVIVQATVFIALVANGMQQPNSTALALSHYARGVGTAAAVQGALGFVFGALLPPIVTSFTGTTSLAMGAFMGSCGVLALVVMLVGRKDLRRER